MSQTKRQSVIESVIQQATGYFVGLGTQYIVFPFYGMEVDLVTNLQIGAIFAIVSTARSYLIRRVFNKQHKPNEALEKENKDLHILVKDMRNYIKKIDGIY